MGGGVPARLCEAAALAAIGAHGTAAQLLTNLAANPNRAMSPGLRAVILDRRRRASGSPPAGPTSPPPPLAEADGIAAPDADRQLLLARVAAAAGRLARRPGRARRGPRRRARTTRWRTRCSPRRCATRATPPPRSPRPSAPCALAPDLPEALFETGAALAETGDSAARRRRSGSQLIAAHPDSDLAPLARANLQRLN